MDLTFRGQNTEQNWWIYLDTNSTMYFKKKTKYFSERWTYCKLLVENPVYGWFCGVYILGIRPFHFTIYNSHTHVSWLVWGIKCLLWWWYNNIERQFTLLKVVYLHLCNIKGWQLVELYSLLSTGITILPAWVVKK